MCARVKSIWEDSFVPLSRSPKETNCFLGSQRRRTPGLRGMHAWGKRGLNRDRTYLQNL